VDHPAEHGRPGRNSRVATMWNGRRRRPVSGRRFRASPGCAGPRDLVATVARLSWDVSAFSRAKDDDDMAHKAIVTMAGENSLVVGVGIARNVSVPHMRRQSRNQSTRRFAPCVSDGGVRGSGGGTTTGRDRWSLLSSCCLFHLQTSLGDFVVEVEPQGLVGGEFLAG